MFVFPTPYVASAAAADCTFVTVESDGASETTYTFSNTSIGTAATDRYVLVGAIGRATATRTLDSMTIGGNSATMVYAPFTDPNQAGFGILLVPADTTADITVTFSGSMIRCAIGVWRVTGLQSTTAVDTDFDEDTQSLATTVDVNADGFVASIVFCTTDPSPTWTGATEDFELTTAQWELNGAGTGASENIASAEVGRSVDCSHSGGTTTAMATISMR